MLALAAGRIARIDGARIVIVTIGDRARDALSVHAPVAGGTRVAVVAGKGVDGENAARGRIARIIGTLIFVVAH